MKTQRNSLRKLRRLLKAKKSNIVWLSYHQCHIFQRFKGREWFVSIVSKFDAIKSTIVFKVTLSKLIDNYPKIKKLIPVIKKHLETITEICKENANKFK